MTDPAPPAESAAPDRHDPARGSGRARATALTLGVLLLVAIALAGWQALRAMQLDEEREEQARAMAVAAQFAEALFTYDHTDLDAARDDVAALATEDFAQTYTEAFDAGLGGIIGEVSASSRAEIRRVYLSEVGDTGVRAVVHLDATVTSDLGERDLTGAYVELDLVRGEQWRVDEVTAISATGESLLPGPGGATPPAGAPTATPTPSEPPGSG